MTEIVVALIGCAGAVATAVIQYMGKREAQRDARAARQELRFQSAALSFTDFIRDWGPIHEELCALLRDTPVDRFLMMRAWNGADAPRWTTALFQFRSVGQNPISYVHVELDGDYVERLKIVSVNGYAAWKVEDMPEGLVKSIYLREGVQSAAWYFVDRQMLEGRDSAAVTYVSFASHSVDVLDDATLTWCRMVVGRMKMMAREIS